MIKMRIQVEEMHVYYYIAKKLISSAKLGFMGFMSSSEEKLINNIYHAEDADEVNDLSKKLFDKLEDEKTELKLNTNHDNLRDIEELIGEAIGYTNNLLFKAEVLDNVSKTLKNDLTTHEKIMLCVDKISQAKRVLMSLSPEERKNILDGKGLTISPKKKNDTVVKAVDEENVENVTEVEIASVDVNEVPLDEEIVEAADLDVDEGNKLKTAFTAQDMPVIPIEHYMVDKPSTGEQSLIDKKLEKIEEEAELLDWDEEEQVEVKEEVSYDEIDNAITAAINSDELEVVEEDNLEASVVYEDEVSEEIHEVAENVSSEEITANSIVENDIQEDVSAVELEENTTDEEVVSDNVVEVPQDDMVLIDEDIDSTKEISEIVSGEVTANVEENSVELFERTMIPPPISIVEPTPLNERLYPNDIGFEPPVIYPAEVVEEVVDNEIEPIVVEDNNFDVPEIFKIIERDGVEVDEDIK